jgi:hypothetical protein
MSIYGTKKPNRLRLQGAVIITAAIAAGTAPAVADIDVAFVPLESVVVVGEIAEIQVYVISDSQQDQLLSAAEIIFTWDPDKLQLLGNHQDGAVNLLASNFPVNHPSGLNESNPPQDGIGMYMAWAPLGEPVAATPGGTLLTTFMFEALAPVSDTPIDILPFVGDPDDPDAKTIVFDGTTPNTDITGVLTGTSVTIIPSCPWDLNGDGVVDGIDLLILLGAWGQCPGPNDCPADFNADGVVDGIDLLEMLGNWGLCP